MSSWKKHFYFYFNFSKFRGESEAHPNQLNGCKYFRWIFDFPIFQFFEKIETLTFLKLAEMCFDEFHYSLIFIRVSFLPCQVCWLLFVFDSVHKNSAIFLNSFKTFLMVRQLVSLQLFNLICCCHTIGLFVCNYRPVVHGVASIRIGNWKRTQMYK